MTREILIDGEVRLEREGRVAHILLNRPEASNGMTVPFLKALYDVVMAVHGDPSVRVAVIAGAGKHFCAGGDVKDFASHGEKLPDYLRQATAILQNIALGLIRLNVPVIASVHGFAAGGGGFGLVCASDFVVAAESARFLTGATRAGMAPDAGASVTLQKMVGFRRAMDLLMRNRPLGAAEALDIGLISRVVADAELAAATAELAAELADGAPLALKATKRLLWNGLGSNVETGLPEEARTVSELSGTADAREALAAIIEKRSPHFRGE